MTKVILSGMVLEYSREMAELVSQTIKTSFIAGLKTFRSLETFLPDIDLMPPPRIELIDLTCYEGKVNELILLFTSNDFEIANIRMSIKDYDGNVIECGYASYFDDDPNLWHYFTQASVPSYKSLVICAVVTDNLGGVGVYQENVADCFCG